MSVWLSIHGFCEHECIFGDLSIQAALWFSLCLFRVVFLKVSLVCVVPVLCLVLSVRKSMLVLAVDAFEFLG